MGNFEQTMIFQLTPYFHFCANDINFLYKIELQASFEESRTLRVFKNGYETLQEGNQTFLSGLLLGEDIQTLGCSVELFENYFRSI